MCVDRCCTLLSRRDAEFAWGGDVVGLLHVIEGAFASFGRGEVVLPEKSSMVLDGFTQSRMNCMPSVMGGLGVAGIKWVSVFPENPAKRDLPNVGGLMVLSEIESGQPTCVMDAAFLTAVRTAGVDAVAARRLARASAASLAVIGSGEQAFYHALMICRAVSGINSVRLAGRTPEHVTALSGKLGAAGVETVNCGSDYGAAVSGADVIVTAISGQEPVLEAGWIDPGALYCHVGGWEDEYGVPWKADKIVCDSWEALKHRGSPTIARMYAEGLLQDSDVYCDLHQILLGEVPGRESESEFIYFNAIGVGFADLAVAEWLRLRAAGLGIGATFDFAGKGEVRPVGGNGEYGTAKED